VTPQLVLVPGLGLDARSSARLRRRVPARVVELPGMGLRGAVPPLDELADLLLAELDGGSVVLVGHSESCQVVVAAAQRDSRVTAVVLLGPTTDPRLRAARGLVARWLRTFWHEPWRRVPGMVAQWVRIGPRAMRELWRRAEPDHIEARLPEVRVPVVVVRGTLDRLCPHDWATGLAAVAPRGVLVEIPGAAHMTPQTHPDEVAAILSSLVEGRSPSAG
jgi:pimeloyl-ACP methyl ester carboxylesterase